MKRLFLLPLLLLLMACHTQKPDNQPSALQQVASFRLSENAELQLLSDGDCSQLELYYCGEFQELAGTANTEFCTDSMGRIAIDTVHLVDTLSVQYIVRTYDRSSTYGAEVWYVVYPYRSNDLDGPWNLVKLPTDRPTLEEVSRYIN